MRKPVSLDQLLIAEVVEARDLDERILIGRYEHTVLADDMAIGRQRKLKRKRATGRDQHHQGCKESAHRSE